MSLGETRRVSENYRSFNKKDATIKSLVNGKQYKISRYLCCLDMK